MQPSCKKIAWVATINAKMEAQFPSEQIMAKRISVILSQGQSNNPGKRRLEEGIIAGLMFESGFDVTVIPNLYDLKADSTGMLALKGISGDMILCSWMFERAAHWILDRNQITGHVGTTLLVNDDEDEEEEELEEDDKTRVIEHREIANRRIYCLDLKIAKKAEVYIDEAKRIFSELNVETVGLNLGSPKLTNGSTQANGSKDHAETGPTPEQLNRLESPTNTTSLAADGNGLQSPAQANGQEGDDPVQRIEERTPRRWYPVIDYSRCTNCLECIDFCLFGVYGIDKIDTILVEQPDNCRKGCPACSRVCPENAIIFPQHKTPVIAGSAELGSSLKIDLSQLFGAPDKNKSATEMAADERDQHLALAGRQTVGMQGLEKRQPKHKRMRQRDELDILADQLDDFDS